MTGWLGIFIAIGGVTILFLLGAWIHARDSLQELKEVLSVQQKNYNTLRETECKTFLDLCSTRELVTQLANKNAELEQQLVRLRGFYDEQTKILRDLGYVKIGIGSFPALRRDTERK